TDPNGNRTCSEYDGLGRQVATAVPGDSLPGTGTRDPICAASGSPTTWTKYLDLGTPGRQRTEVYAKNGGPATTLPNGGVGLPEGVYVKRFTDGLGRVIQTCSQVDATTNATHPEVCSSTTYDSMGRVATVSIPFYNDTAGAQVVTPPAGLQYTSTQYDA